MKDKIKIKDLTVRGIIGVNDWEREKEQEIRINLEIETDLSRAGETDDIKDTVNYRDISKSILRHVPNAERYTLEALADDIAEICLDYRAVEQVTVFVEKPHALRFSRSVGVEITRQQEPGEET